MTTRGMLGVMAAAVMSVAGTLRTDAHTVTASVLNVRSGPGYGYTVTGSLTHGTVVNVTGTSGSWSKINSPKTGWVYSAYLANTPHSGGGTTTTSSGSDLVWPVSGRVNTTWWYRTLSINGGFHGAVDIGGNSGAAAGAARQGKIIIASYGWNGGYGNLVRISHGNGWTTDYHHFRSGGIAVRYGQSVSRLQTVGYVGATGMTTGPHLHFDLRRYGTKVLMTAYVGQYLTKGRAVPNNYSGL